MRPTALDFRSPKERTPGPYYPLVLTNGKSASFLTSTQNPSFGKGQRFACYKTDAKRIGRRVGPGTYSIHDERTTKSRAHGAPVYRPLHFVKGKINNGYYFIGNNLIYDPEFADSQQRTVCPRKKLLKKCKSQVALQAERPLRKRVNSTVLKKRRQTNVSSLIDQLLEKAIS